MINLIWKNFKHHFNLYLFSSKIQKHVRKRIVEKSESHEKQILMIKTF